MERYYKANAKTSKRSEKNKELYYAVSGIDDVVEYSNIEAVAPLDKTNEIDITKIKKMLQSREDYKRQREYQNSIGNRKIEEPVRELEPEPIRSYDIKEELEKINVSKTEPTYRTLDDTSYKVLKQLKINKTGQKEKIFDEEEKNEQTLVNTRMLKELNDEQLSLNMFEDLASSSKTEVKDKTSITALLEEAKRIDEKKQKEREEKKIDNSFYTSSLNIDRKDFEGLYDKSNFIITSNQKIKIVAIGIALVSILIIIFMIIKFK